MLVKYFDGVVQPKNFALVEGANELLKKALGTVKVVENHFNHFEVAEAAQEMNIQLGTIIKSPMEGLIKYHSGK